jgi:hypothetical protein
VQSLIDVEQQQQAIVQLAGAGDQFLGRTLVLTHNRRPRGVNT